jgi:hypothetical protein
MGLFKAATKAPHPKATDRRLRAARKALDSAECCFARNCIADALHCDQEALRLGVDSEQGAFRRWSCYMMLGDFERAWQETDRSEAGRRARDDTTQQLPLHQRRVWNRFPLANQRVLLRCYHGLGDTLQFVRFLPNLRNLARGVIVQVQAALLPLLNSLPESERDVYIALDSGEVIPEYDVEIELMELPYAFRTTLTTVPNAVPYLQLPTQHVVTARKELNRKALTGAALKVGIVWSSGLWNPERNIALANLATLGRIAGVQLFSLQRGEGAKREMEIHGRTITPTERDSGTPLDTAATIANLDLVISVDTMVAHLAGALGKPVWTLLPFRADWRWMIERDDSPWYPTMRLFRQRQPGDWGPVMERAAEALRQVAQKKFAGC